MLPEPVDPIGEVRLGTVVEKQDIGDTAALLVIGLAGHAPVGLLARQSSRLQSRQPQHGGRLDHQDAVEEILHRLLDQERDVVDGHAARARLLHAVGRHLSDPRQRDGLESAAVPRVAEDAFGQRRPVQGPVPGQDGGPERLQTSDSPGVPGSTTSRAMASASTMLAPRAASRRATVDLPDADATGQPTRSTDRRGAR